MPGIRIEYSKGGKKTVKPQGYEGAACHEATRPYEPKGAKGSIQVSSQEAENVEIELSNNFNFGQNQQTSQN